MIRNLRQNIRHSVRMLLKKPGFTIMAVLTLALGIGATTAIFSVVYATLFEPMPYPKPDQLVMVWSQVKQGRNSVSAGDYIEWKRRSTSFQYLEAWGRAVTRDGRFPEEQLAPLEALSIFSEGSAAAAGELSVAGTLRPGKRADFIGLDEGEPETGPWEQLRVAFTVTGGKVVYRAG